MRTSRNVTTHLADEISSLVGRYSRQEDLSIHEMLRRTGYQKQQACVTVEAIRGALSKNPERLAEWLEYSENKRSVTGWYLRKADSGGFEVGCLHNDGSISEQRRYQKLEEACGEFILREVEWIAVE